MTEPFALDGAPPAEIAVTDADMIACVSRELRMRRVVYPRQVANGRMKQGDADREIARMAAVLARLEGRR